MGDAVWLFLATPKWFFSTILSPLSAGFLTAIPAFGVVCLIAAIALAIRQKAASLLAFGLPFLVSQAFVAFAGLMRGEFTNSSDGPILIAFLLFQLGFAALLTYRHRKNWLPALLFAAFTLCYALDASFVAGMAFADDWL